MYTKMKLVLLVLIGCIALVVCQKPEDIILKQDSDVNPDGSYKYSYETGNGIAAQEEGHLVNPDTINVQGSYQYTGPDGIPISVQYVSNENGFQPQGPHIPQIPAAIQRSLEWNAAHPEEDKQ